MINEVAFHPTMSDVFVNAALLRADGARKLGEIVPGWNVEVLKLPFGGSKKIGVVLRKQGSKYTSLSVTLDRYSAKANSFKIDILGKHTPRNVSHWAFDDTTDFEDIDSGKKKWEDLIPPLPSKLTAADLYHFLIMKAGMTLVTTAQAPGGMMTWQRLEKKPGVVVFLWDKKNKQAINNHEIDVGDTHVDVDGMDFDWDDNKALRREFGYLENKALVAAPARKPYIKKGLLDALPTAKNIAKNRNKL